MTAISPITPSPAVSAAQAATAGAHAEAAPAVSFPDLLTQGLHDVESRVRSANAMVQAFAVDDSVPVHQVTIAIEQARLSVELALQIRSRAVDGFREIMNMQL